MVEYDGRSRSKRLLSPDSMNFPTFSIPVLILNEIFFLHQTRYLHFVEHVFKFFIYGVPFRYLRSTEKWRTL